MIGSKAVNSCTPSSTYFVKPGLELVDLGLLDEQMLLVQVLDDVVAAVLAVDVDEHGLDGGVALDERAPRGFDHGEVWRCKVCGLSLIYHKERLAIKVSG